MSIWSSTPEDVPAIDMHDPRADQYAGTGPVECNIDVATARSWHGMIRISAYSEGTTPALDAEFMLTHDAAAALMRNLGRALSAVVDGA